MPDLRQRARSLRLLRYSPKLYALYAACRASHQDWLVARETGEYARRATALGLPLEPSRAEVRAALFERLAARGLRPRRRPKGELHVLYVTRPSNWEPHNIPPELSRFGRLTTYYYTEHGFDCQSDGWVQKRSEFERDLLSFVRALHARTPIDAFVGYLAGWHVSRETLLQIGAMGIVTYGFHWDDKVWFRGPWAGGRWTGPAAVAAAYDLNLTNAPDSIAKYAVEGGIALFWPEAANPDHFRPLERPKEYGVSLVGGCYGYRPVLVDYLRRHGVDVKTFGPGWLAGEVAGQDGVEIYARSRINLGVGGILFSRKLQCLKTRDFEVPMSGALYLTSFNPELERVYDLEKEIVTYRSKEECLSKVRQFLADPEAADRVRRAGRERCLRDHSWDRRFSEAFSLAGLM